MADHDLHAIAFPRFDDTQMAGLARCSVANLKRFRDGEKLFQACFDSKFYVVKSGKVEIIDVSGEAPRTVVVHEPGHFAGELTQLSGNPAIVNGVARGDCEVYEFSPEALRQLLNDHPGLSDIIMQALIGAPGLSGDGHLSEVEFTNNQTGETRKLKTPALFSFIGAVPRTEWLPPEIEKDAKGFVRTGPALAQSPSWTAGRPPFLLETSRSGVFAAGDVRSGSIKRVASAVGEGAMAVQFVHEYLAHM